MGGVAILPGIGITGKVALKPVSSREGLNGGSNSDITPSDNKFIETNSITAALSAVKLKKPNSTDMLNRINNNINNLSDSVVAGNPSEPPFDQTKLKKATGHQDQMVSEPKPSAEFPSLKRISQESSEIAKEESGMPEIAVKLKKISQEKLDLPNADKAIADRNLSSNSETNAFGPPEKMVPSWDSSEATPVPNTPVKRMEDSTTRFHETGKSISGKTEVDTAGKGMLRDTSSASIEVSPATATGTSWKDETITTTTSTTQDLQTKLENQLKSASRENLVVATTASATMATKDNLNSPTIRSLSKPTSPVRDTTTVNAQAVSSQPEFLNFRTKLRSVGVKLDLADDKKEDEAAATANSTVKQPPMAVHINTLATPPSPKRTAKSPTKPSSPTKEVSFDVASKRVPVDTASNVKVRRCMIAAF